ncbi:hypothetical protein [Streptomyces sp. NPDC058758]|uniref:hypothetical protein n=1 Tax=Streptomyces sp. NPDC058758 TaxID=3346627 RepID=UPI0036C3AC55
MARALDLRETAGALEAYRRSGVRKTAGGGVLLALSLGIASSGSGPAWQEDLVGWLAVLGVTGLVLGTVNLAYARRFRRVLGAGAWSAHAAVPVARSWTSEAVVLSHGPGGDELWPLAVVATRPRWEPLRPARGAVMWWCGDPAAGGVLAPPGGGALVWTRPVRGRKGRRRLVERAAGEGLAGMPVPVQPQPAPAPGADPGAAPGAAPGPVPGPEEERRKERLRLLTGRWRWLVVASALVLALSWSWAGAAETDPQVDLTVLSEEADGGCVVRWKDPWDGSERSGPFHCDPTRDPLLVGTWESAFVVSYGPWKGDLYGYDAEGARHGSQALGAVDTIGLASVGGVLLGLVAGWATFWNRWHRRRRAAREAREGRGGRAAASTAPSTAGPAGTPRAGAPSAGAPSLPSYARLAAQAERQAVPQPGPPRPEADVREAPWWRVRSLRRWAGVRGLLLLPAFLAGAVVAGFVVPPDPASAIPAVAAGVLLAVLLVRNAFRFLTAGLPAVRLVVRAATAPVPVVRRYALLHDPYGGGPVLVLFPGHGGDDDLPEGVLELAAPGPPKRPWRGLPAEPTGTVELRGWLDRADDGDPFVVAWHEGRALWPAAPYREAGSAEASALLGRLAPPVETPAEAPPEEPSPEGPSPEGLQEAGGS